MPSVISVRIASPHKSGVGKFWPSPLLEMPSVIGPRVLARAVQIWASWVVRVNNSWRNKIWKEMLDQLAFPESWNSKYDNCVLASRHDCQHDILDP
jgi:hypothetical protein